MNEVKWPKQQHNIYLHLFSKKKNFKEFEIVYDLFVKIYVLKLYKLRLRFKSTLDGVPAKTHAGISPSNLVCLSQRLDVQGSAKRWTLG